MAFRKFLNLVKCDYAKKHARITAFLLILLIVYYGYQVYDDKEVMYFRHTGSNTPCVLPELDPYDKKMMEYVWRPDPLVCAEPPVVFVDASSNLQYNLTAMKLINESPSSVKCEIYYIKRIFDDDIEFLDPFPWQPPQPLTEDFLRVKCTGTSGKLFDNTLTRIQKKEKPLQTLSYALSEDKYNLILFGMDSLSRSSAVRQMPKTFSYLKTLGAYDMKGYMKVADNTFVNVAPLLSGKFPMSDEFPPTDYTRDHLDHLPLIWKNFSEKHTATLFAEDLPNLGMFNMDKRGFLHPPTDHFMRPFWLANFKLMPLHNLRTHVSRVLEHSKMKIGKTSALCLADKPNHVVLMDYIKQFMVAYKNQRKFSMSFLTELTHEFQNLANLGDGDIEKFLKWLSDEGFLNNTIVIMFSDHGLKFGNNQHLFVARMENRMPFLSIVIPENLKRKYPAIDRNLKINRERLASTFDLHATIRDILHGNLKHPGKYEVKDKVRGISLFQELPDGRSCADASIKEEFCACYMSTKLNVTGNPLADKIARAVIKHINYLLQDHSECAKVTINEILELRKIEQGLKYSGTWRKKNMWLQTKNMEAEVREDTRHVIVLETVPGHAQFFATCDIVNDKIQVFENVDRINKYGNQSHCINVHELKPLCYCND